MKMHLVVFILISAVGCATTSSVEAVKPSNSGPAVSDESKDSSKVLNKTKCPKNSKIVNGKCTLQVESDDE